MNKTLILIGRIIIAVLVAINIYFEAGIFTSTVVFFLYGSFEYDVYSRKNFVKQLDDLAARITLYTEANQKHRDQMLQEINDFRERLKGGFYGRKEPGSIYPKQD